MKKVLIIGDANNQILNEYIISIKNITDEFIFSIYNINHVSRLKEEYKKNYNKIFPSYSNRFFTEKIKYIRILFKPLYQIINFYTISEKFDIIHIKHIYPFYIFMLPKMKKIGNKIIGTVWSMEYKRGLNFFFGKLVIQNFYNKLDVITLSNLEIKNELVEKYNLKAEIYILKYGLINFEELNKLNINSSNSKKAIGLDPSKITISVGYSGKEIHNHEKVLNSLIPIKEEIIDKIQIILPMMYGGTPTYQEKIFNKYIKYFPNTKIFNTFLDKEELYHLRISTDILIQLSDFDHSSASVLESLLCGAIVISGDWLPYKNWAAEGLKFFTIKDFGELKIVLIHCVNEFNRLKADTAINTNVLQKFKWSEVITEWVLFYNKILVY